MSKPEENFSLHSMLASTTLQVYFGNNVVGTLALTPKGLTAFEYSDSWLIEGFSISPLSLPLQKKVFIPSMEPFAGLFGVFNDSLPDGWGRLLVDRYLLQQGLEPASALPLARLTLIGAECMGALVYVPGFSTDFAEPSAPDLDALATQSMQILTTKYSDNLDDLFALGGSSGGARPKILTKYQGDDWIIKFPSSTDAPNVGEQEYRYSLAARDCGIEMPPTKLFDSNKTSGYFGVKRFDRLQAKRIHMVSASGLLETSHRIPNLDYHTLMKLTLIMTDDFAELLKLFRQMCFNVFAHNRDDHSKNFSYLYDTDAKRWQFSPAYDLTYNAGMAGEHATTVNGKGKNIDLDDLLEVATRVGLSKSKSKQIAQEIQEVVNEYALTTDVTI